MTEKIGRPFGVTIVFILLVIGGLAGIVTGVMGIISRNDAEAAAAGVVASCITIVVGLIYLLVAKGIAKGSAGARFIIGLVTLLSLLAGIWAVIFLPGARIAGLVQILFAVIILGLLYNSRAKVFFSNKG